MIGSFRGGAICTAHHVHERPPRIRHPAREESLCPLAGLSRGVLGASIRVAGFWTVLLPLDTLGTAPGAFRHPVLGRVGLRIMWLDLRDPGNATN